jgi:hypothetical protein
MEWSHSREAVVGQIVDEFTETEDTLSPSQESNTLFCPAPNESIHSLVAYFHMSIFRSTSRSQMSLPFTFADQNVCTSRFSYLLRQSYSPSYGHSNAVVWSKVLFFNPLAFFVLVSDTLLATVLPNALCLLSSLDVRNLSSGQDKWGMERRDSERLVLLLWFPNFWSCQHFEEFTGSLKFCSCRV